MLFSLVSTRRCAVVFCFLCLAIKGAAGARERGVRRRTIQKQMRHSDDAPTRGNIHTRQYPLHAMHNEGVVVKPHSLSGRSDNKVARKSMVRSQRATTERRLLEFNSRQGSLARMHSKGSEEEPGEAEDYYEFETPGGDGSDVLEAQEAPEEGGKDKNKDDEDDEDDKEEEEEEEEEDDKDDKEEEEEEEEEELEDTKDDKDEGEDDGEDESEEIIGVFPASNATAASNMTSASNETIPGEDPDDELDEFVFDEEGDAAFPDANEEDGGESSTAVEAEEAEQPEQEPSQPEPQPEEDEDEDEDDKNKDEDEDEEEEVEEDFKDDKGEEEELEELDDTKDDKEDGEEDDEEELAEGPAADEEDTNEELVAPPASSVTSNVTNGTAANLTSAPTEFEMDEMEEDEDSSAVMAEEETEEETDDFFVEPVPDPDLYLVETTPCIELEDAYIYMTRFQLNEPSCMEDPNSCTMGCCRLDDHIRCDEENALADLPCICNMNTAE